MTGPAYPCLKVTMFPGLVLYSQTEEERQADRLVQEHINSAGSRSMYILAVEASMRLNTAPIMKLFSRNSKVRLIIDYVCYMQV